MVDKEMQRLAAALGIRDVHRLNTADLIACIREQEGEIPCYSQPWSAPCRIRDCPLRHACTSTGQMLGKRIANG
jgi:hypothetical protein